MRLHMTMTHPRTPFFVTSRYKDRLRAHLSDELAQLAFEPHAAQKYSLPFVKGRRQPLPSSQPSESDEWYVPSTAAQNHQPAEGEGQEQWLEQSATITRCRRAPVRHGHLSSCTDAKCCATISRKKRREKKCSRRSYFGESKK